MNHMHERTIVGVVSRKLVLHVLFLMELALVVVGIMPLACKKIVMFFTGPTGDLSKIYLWMRVPDIKGAFACTCKNTRKNGTFQTILIILLLS